MCVSSLSLSFCVCACVSFCPTLLFLLSLLYHHRDTPDKEILELVAIESDVFMAKLKRVEDKLIRMLIPRDDADNRNAVLEVRAGTGGEEASLFAS